jgi:two-component system, NtrC family, nitrogen regulation response regulator NtrX
LISGEGWEGSKKYLEWDQGVMAARILVVDDESGIRESLGAALRDEGYEVETAASAEECLTRIEEQEFNLVMLDVWLPKMDGLEALEKIQQRDGAPMVVMISGHGNIETAVRSTKLGAFDFIEKPLSLDKVSLSVRNALEYVRLEDENKRLRAELEHKHQVQGNSVPMKALRQQIALTGPTNGRVLIYGESGTGKELVARALHASSARNAAPFVEVNCAAIQEELIESEMFGHRKGSFAGASEDKIGKFQRADGGTLFLDEVGDMSLKTQSKVLRVLEEQRIEPLGASAPVKVDVRVIAATNKKLEDEIARNAFREDLFYRLNVIPFYVPALRERTEDIPILASHFLAEFSQEYGKKPKEFTPGAMEVLMAYPWPGNVRELKNLVERLVIVCPSTQIETHHLPPEVFRGAQKSPQKPYASLQEARSAYEREFVLRKLEESRWNMTRAAEALGLERSHLYRKMRALGIASGKTEA